MTSSIIKLGDAHTSTLIDIASKSDRKILLLDECAKNVAKRSIIGVRCAHGTTKAYDLKSVFAQSQFCLIAKTERLFQYNLIEALAANCIPVVFADNVILPLTEVRYLRSDISIVDFFSSFKFLFVETLKSSSKELQNSSKT